MNDRYPTFESLNIAPDFLRLGVSAMLGLRTYGFLNDPRTQPPNVPMTLLDRAQGATVPKRKHVKTAPTPRTYKSKYVGVTEHRNRWLAQYGPRGSIKTKVYPLTPEGELAAAWERARALGLDAPELRPVKAGA